MDQSKFDEIFKSRKMLQNYHEFLEFFRIVENLKPKRIIEIGSAWGGTLRFWCEILQPGGSIISIDQDPGSRLVDLLDQYPSLSRVCGTSQSDDIVKTVAGKVNDVDLLFIDGGHLYEDVRDDYRLYSPLVRKGGIIAFHDTGDAVNLDPPVGPRKLFEEIKNDLDNPYSFCHTAEISGMHENMPDQKLVGGCGISLGYKK